jgi:hypothetical protein
MDDEDIFSRINTLAHEEHDLFDKEAHGAADPGEKERLRALEVALDQCWDLLHQRRARRNAGLNPDEATLRDPSTVEGYLG